MRKAVIFDLNGIFLSSELLNRRVEAKWGIAKEQFLPALLEIMEIVRKPAAPPVFSLWKPYFQKWGMNLSKKEFFTFWFSGEKINTRALRFTLELRKRGVKVFLLSNNFKERTEYYQKHFPELFESVDNAYFSWKTGFVKPDRKAWLNVLKENKLDPKECLYFDDSEKNVTVARELGITAYVFAGTAKMQEIVKKELNTIRGSPSQWLKPKIRCYLR
ncbi:HAD-IA family hydrolase [Candidatus Woesearchaeota archaeon]|nr:HAD-IA family hydrolase [Candidatus Woesearchaeota archaeon]